MQSLAAPLRVPPDGIDLSSGDTRATPQAPGGKGATKKHQADLGDEFADLQERLYAQGRTGGRRSLLLVLQGLDTSGKGGTIRHVVGQMDPQGVRITAFKAPHPRSAGTPSCDVVTVRVKELAPRSTWSRRYDVINRFEERLVQDGMRIVKCFLHISRAEFRERQLARLDDPTKHWKYNPADLEVYSVWGDYLEAYTDALTRCSTEAAPWHVIPADRKWYRNWAVTRLLIDELERMELDWPPASFDVDAERARVRALE